VLVEVVEPEGLDATAVPTVTVLSNPFILTVD